MELRAHKGISRLRSPFFRNITNMNLDRKDVIPGVFLSSANEVSTGPTCQFLSVCLSVCLFVCLSVFPVFFSRRLIGSYTGFWQWFWQPTYPTRCSELGWAVPHSDFLAWLSSATLKNSISGVSSQITGLQNNKLVLNAFCWQHSVAVRKFWQNNSFLG